MKRIFLTAAVLAGLASAAQAAERQITVTGEATLEKRAEVFVVAINVSERNRNRAASLAQAAAKLEAVKEALSKLDGLEEAEFKNSDADTAAIRPNGCYESGYREGRTSEACAPIDYQTRIALAIEAKPASAAGNVIALMSDLDLEGAEIRGFALADPEAARQEARAMALKKAMEQAEFLAREAGARLGKPVNISYAEREAAVSRELGLVDRDRIVVTGARLSRPSTSIDLPPGVLSVEERVTVTFELLRGR